MNPRLTDANRTLLASLRGGVAVLGGGESGTGAALLAASRELGVFLSDGGTLNAKNCYLLEQAGVPFEESGHTLAKLVAMNVLVKSPGIDPGHEVVQAFRAAGKPVIDELELAGLFASGKRICITGSNGKTTTTLLAYHLLKEAGLDVGLAGNVGRSMAAQLADNFDPKYWVLEISSFQLDGMPGFLKDVSVLLNVTPDHLDRYGRMEAYFDSKMQVFESMAEGGASIFYSDDRQIVSRMDLDAAHPLPFGTEKPEAYGAWLEGKTLHLLLEDETRAIDLSEIPLQGIHNHMNAAAALLAATAGTHKHSGVFEKGLHSFTAPAHRLEQVGELNGITFINDSKATNVDSTYFALKAMERPVVLMAGGKDKGNDYGQILDLVKQKVKHLVCLTHYPEPLQNAFGAFVPMEITENVDEAVALAYRAAPPGSVVLLSPACASFDLFKNYEDRGDQFRAAVLRLVKSEELRVKGLPKSPNQTERRQPATDNASSKPKPATDNR